MIVGIFNPTAEIVIPKELLNTEAKKEIKTQIVSTEMKRGECLK